MSGEERLLERGASPLELRLLRAVAHEEPSGEGMRRTAAVLGLSIVGLTGASAVTTAAAASTATAGTAAAAGSVVGTGTAAAGGVGLFTIKVWAIVLGVGFLAGGAVVVGIAMPLTGSPGASATTALAIPVSREGPSAGSPPGLGTTGLGGEAAAPPLVTGSASEVPVQAPSNPIPVAAPQPPTDTVQAQIVLIDRARAGLRSGNPQASLRALEEYRRAFPRGAFGQEAMLLQIEALARSGQAGAARQLGERFLQANPESPHARRVRAAIGGL